MNKQSNHQDNRGMTLVELLVSVVILAIVVVPLLHTFITAARTNMIARQRLRMTTAAQDIMEGLKADSIEELAYQFNYPEVSHAANPDILAENEFHVLRRNLINNGLGGISEVRATIDEGTREMTAIAAVNPTETDENMVPSIHSTDDGVNYEFVKKPDGKYYFVLQNVTLQNARFDALIEVDASEYRSGGTIATDTARHNEKEVVDIQGMDTRYDAFYVQPVTMLTSVLQEMNSPYAPATPIKEEDLFMKIVMEVKNTPSSSGKNLTTATIHYEFSTIDTPADVYEADYDFFSNYATGAELRNVYLFYYPLYGGKKPDEIIYKNANSVPSTLHVIKQEPVDTTYLNTKELNYKCNFNIEETGDRVNPITKLHTNLDTNLNDVYFPELTPTPLPVFNIKYYLNSVQIARDSFNIQTLSGEKTIDRIFDVIIDLYEPGTLDVTSSSVPSAESRLTTLRGTKN